MYQLKMQQIAKWEKIPTTKSNININSSFHLRKHTHTHLHINMSKSNEQHNNDWEKKWIKLANIKECKRISKKI